MQGWHLTKLRQNFPTLTKKMIKPPLEVSSSSEDFFLIEGGKATGPFKGIEVWAKIQAGKINGNTPARTHSVATWMKLNHTSWEKYGIRVNDDFDQPDTASEKNPSPFRMKAKISLESQGN